MTSVSNAEEINLSDESATKDLLPSKGLDCQMKETNYDGPIRIDTTRISGNKFKGTSTEWCQQELTWPGKFKKNKMKFTQHGASTQNCYCRKGTLIFSKNNEGDIIAEGHYGVACGTTPFRGTLKCIVYKAKKTIISYIHKQ